LSSISARPTISKPTVAGTSMAGVGSYTTIWDLTPH